MRSDLLVILVCLTLTTCFPTGVQASEREGDLREKFITVEPTPRVMRIRQRQLGQLQPLATPARFGIDDLRIATRVWKETEGEPEVVRRAKVLAAKVREMPIHIGAEELLVGWRGNVSMGEGRLGEWGHLFGMQMEMTVDQYAPFLSDEDARELREELIPYWKARDYVIPIPPQMREAGITELWSRPHLPHWTPNWEKLLEKGLLGIKEDAEERLARLDLTKLEDVEKIPFLEGVIIGLEAAAEIGGRYAARARELAATEADPRRKAELLKIAEVCDRVPAKPPRTFYEALQSCEFVHLLLFWEGTNAAVEPGRVDQYLYPYYESDIQEGRTTRETAQELIDCWFLKYSGGLGAETSKETHGTGGGKIDYGARPGGGPSHHCHVGGLKADGSDGTNELSYMFLEPYLHFQGMLAPSISVFVHSKTPDDLLIKACQVNALGGSWPMFINQDLLVENLLARAAADEGPPLSLADARRYCSVVGCHEPMIAGRESGFGAASIVTTPHTHQPAHAEDEASQPETVRADSQPHGEERGLKAVGENLQRTGERIQAAIAKGELSEEEGWAKWHDAKEQTINGAVAAGTISAEEAGLLRREIEKGEAAARLETDQEKDEMTEEEDRTKWAEIREEDEDEEQNSQDYGAGLPGLLMSLLRSREFESFEELRTAIEQSFGEPGIHEAAHDMAEVMGLKPSLLASALTEDCIERGIAREKGGARYNTRAGGLVFASPDFANSLAAVKKLVFEEKKITMDELLEAVDNNFEGYEDIRKMCLDAPKFGNDDDSVDELLAWITHLACEPGRKCKTIYGGRRYPSLIPLAYSVSAGREMGALPSGRLAGEPLSDGVSPTPGSDFNGPTSVLKSVGKVNNAEVGLGQALNIKLDPAVFGTVDGFGRFAALVRVFVDQKVDHVQFNVVSSDTLKAAQKEPEKYLELTVKVAGYNARFVRLYKEIQDSIIAKTEHRGF